MTVPAHSDSFVLGVLPPSQRQRLPVVDPRPMLLRPVVADVQTHRDSLGLGFALTERIRNLEPEGTPLPFGLLDTADRPDAWAVQIDYRQRGSTVRATIWLSAPERTDQIEIQRLRVRGTSQDIDALAANILTEITNRLP